MQFRVERYILIAGDIITLAIVTIIGFASHGTAGTAGARMLTTFLPLTAAWLLIAPHLKLYDQDVILEGRQLWRPLWAMVLAAPMAAWLRGLILNLPIPPIFISILGGVSAVAIIIWRGIFWLMATRLKRIDG